MEVHQHTHTPRKKWSHYFWEFLMLFLAVFCGFLAENIREHKIERTREKQFMRSMIEDLKSDTASATSLNKLRDDRYKMYDSLTGIILENKYADNSAAVYYWGRSVSRRAFFVSSDGTLQQLKNSGGLRLISDKAITDSIMSYDVLYRNLLQRQELEESMLSEYRVLAGKVFDAAVIKKMKNLNGITFEKPDGNPPLKNTSPELLNELSNKLNYWVANSVIIYGLLERLKAKGTILIELIKKEYHLK